MEIQDSQTLEKISRELEKIGSLLTLIASNTFTQKSVLSLYEASVYTGINIGRLTNMVTKKEISYYQPFPEDVYDVYFDREILTNLLKQNLVKPKDK